MSRDQISLPGHSKTGENMELSMLEHDYRQLALASRKATASSGLASFIWSASSAKEGENIKESAERMLLLLRGESAIDAETLCVCWIGCFSIFYPSAWSAALVRMHPRVHLRTHPSCSLPLCTSCQAQAGETLVREQATRAGGSGAWHCAETGGLE